MKKRHITHLAKRPLDALYHHHQRFWNVYTAAVASRLFLLPVLIGLDSLALLLEVFVRRIRRLGLSSVMSPSRSSSSGLRINYFDLGLHREALQTREVLRWFGDHAELRIYGFEAHPEYCSEAASSLAGLEGINVVNAAVVGPDHSLPTVDLYLGGGSGIADSIHPRVGAARITVKAIRLSDFILRNGIELDKGINLLRMNIEGAESAVLSDLADRRLLKSFDGFFGTWDDLFKVDPSLDEELRRFMRVNRIRPIPFNDRDLKCGVLSRLRKAAIRYDIVTSLICGTKSKKGQVFASANRHADSAGTAS